MRPWSSRPSPSLRLASRPLSTPGLLSLLLPILLVCGWVDVVHVIIPSTTFPFSQEASTIAQGPCDRTSCCPPPSCPASTSSLSFSTSAMRFSLLSSHNSHQTSLINSNLTTPRQLVDYAIARRIVSLHQRAEEQVERAYSVDDVQRYITFARLFEPKVFSSFLVLSSVALLHHFL